MYFHANTKEHVCCHGLDVALFFQFERLGSFCVGTIANNSAILLLCKSFYMQICFYKYEWDSEWSSESHYLWWLTNKKLLVVMAFAQQLCDRSSNEWEKQLSFICYVCVIFHIIFFLELSKCSIATFNNIRSVPISTVKLHISRLFFTHDDVTH